MVVPKIAHDKYYSDLFVVASRFCLHFFLLSSKKRERNFIQDWRFLIEFLTVFMLEILL